jgi:uncharacterized protein (TIGR02270 family)
MTAIPFVLSQHAEEAAFHWLLRDDAVGAPHYDLRDLAKLDGRVDAHVDGLRVAGAAGWASVREELAWEEPGEVFVATLLALEAGDEERLAEALAVAASAPELARGAISALGWLPFDHARPWIARLLGSDDPALRAIAIGGAAVHRHDPGPPLGDALLGDDASPRKRALSAAGELGRTDLLSHCRARYDADDEDERFRAACSGALLGDLDSVPVLTALAQAGGAYAERAADLAARRMPIAQALAWSSQLARAEGLQRIALRVAGATGDPVIVPWLFELMAVEHLARPAGEAFSLLTGLDLAFLDLEAERPEGFESGPTELPEDEDVALDADEDLPWPDVARLRAWWAGQGGAFSPGTRYLLAEPLAAAGLRRAIAEGRQRQRAAAALELALAEPARPLFEVRAPGPRQRAMLSAGRGR